MQTYSGWQRFGFFAVASLALVIFLTGCPTTGTTPVGNATVVEGEDNDNSGEVTEARVISLATDLRVSGNQNVTIRYAVPTSASNTRAFYVQESDRDNTGAISYFEFGTPLQSGTSQFTINSDDLPRGRFYIGLSYINSAGSPVFSYSSGLLIIEGLPLPSFFMPASDMQFVLGLDNEPNVDILVDLGDPEGEVRWRLFFVTDATAPDLGSVAAGQIATVGTELATGTGNVAEYEWNVGSVAPGAYRIGISATDSGFSVAETAAASDGDRIQSSYNEFRITLLDEEQVTPEPPLVTVSAPASPVATFLTEDVAIEFIVTFREGDQQEVTVFYDNDNNIINGPLGEIESGLDGSDTSAVLNTADLEEGVYFVGVTADDGKNDPVTSYAAGTVSVAKSPTLTVTSPSSAGVLTRPSGQAIIAWMTNVPPSAAQTEVFVTPDTNGDGVGDGEPIVVRELSDDEAMSVQWQPIGLIGRFIPTVRIVFNDDSVADLSAQAPGAIRVSTAPRITWVGEFADAEASDPKGAIFGGVQFEDNLGSSMTPVGDLDGDGNAEFVIVSRYGKPFFSNPDGIGHGEAYLIFGNSDRLTGVFNMNTLGTSGLRGITFAGIRSPQGITETDGLSDVERIPDVDGDGLDELVFGFPNVDSRGHNIDPEQDGVVFPRSLASLEAEDQFLRGGIVIYSSMNPLLKNPASSTPVVLLDMVGQDFEVTCVQPEPEAMEDDDLSAYDTIRSVEGYKADRFIADLYNPTSDPPCDGSCPQPAAGAKADGTYTIQHGFVRALARDFFHSYVVSSQIYGGTSNCNAAQQFIGAACAPFPFGPLDFTFCPQFTDACEPSSPGLHRFIDDFFGVLDPLGIASEDGRSGFYPTFVPTGAETFRRNEPLEPFGARIIGVGMGDKFGTSLAVTNSTDFGAGDILVSAPGRDARGILLGPFPGGCNTPPECGGEIDGLESSPGTAKTNTDAGVAYLFQLRSLWTDEQTIFGTRIPPKPHQYIVGEASHCGGLVRKIDNVSAVRIAGAPSESITNITGIKDFNGDGRDDFAVGSPTSDRVYVCFRRDPAIEGDYVLEKLELAVGDAQRLSGSLVTGATGSQFAASMATNVDLNNDGDPDLIVSAPEAAGSVGEVYIIFASPELITPQNGTNIETLIAEGRAAKIIGGDPGDFFGYNVANGGDIDGDGLNDLLVSAPGATPRYDTNPFDDDDSLNEIGLDLDGDGLKDDLTSASPGTWGRPEGEVTDIDNLEDAGLVYVIWGSNVIEGAVDISDLGTTGLEGAIVVGRRGGDPAAGRTGDFLGGGDAGDTAFGGITPKRDRGRSFGLRAAGDVDGDGKGDFLIGSIIATPRIDPTTGQGTTRGGEAYLVYGFDR